MSFTPTRLAISSITRTYPCVVTTSLNHKLTTGQVVRLTVPTNYGMVELNNKAFSITVLSTNNFSLQYSQVPVEKNVDSRDYTAFVIPTNPSLTAQVLPIGAGPTPVSSTVNQVLRNSCESLLDDATTNIET